MKCPFCQSDESKVLDKRDSGEDIRRRRECLKCKRRFTTYENIEEAKIFVVKKDGRREPFSRDKLRSGFIKACEKRPVSQEKIDNAVSEIEQKLKEKGKEVSSKIIGELVIKKLKCLDKVAYIRFASVYREFADVSEFKKALNEFK
jgi:transcriptional repressor NrdR